MATITLKLTSDQQQQIRNATGKNIAELNIDVASTGGLSDTELDRVAGGALDGIKGESMDESFKGSIDVSL